MASPIMTGQFELTPAEAAPLLSRSRDFSWYQQFAKQINLKLAGTTIPVWDNDIEGSFVEEGQKKPVAGDTVSTKQMVKRKWALMVPISKETARASASGEQGIAGYVQTIRDRISASLARDIDRLAATGAGIGGQSYMNQTTKTVALGTATKENGGLWADFNAGLQLLVEDNRSLDAWLFDQVVEPMVNAAVDLNGNPLWFDKPLTDINPMVRPGTLMGRPAGLVKKLRNGTGAGQVVGYGGDFSRAFYGLLSNLSFSASDQASFQDAQGNWHSAYQENLIVILAEAELGVLIADPEDFVKFTSATGAPTS